MLHGLGSSMQAAAGTGAPASRTLALLREHRGIWEGRYSHLAPDDRRVLESQLFRIRVDILDAPRPGYRQTSHYWWPDGREAELVYEGFLDSVSDRIVIGTERMTGSCRAIDERVLYVEFGYRATPQQRVGEMIQLSRDGRHRARTWHWYEDERLTKLTLVRETHASLDPADWPIKHQRPADYAFDRI